MKGRYIAVSVGDNKETGKPYTKLVPVVEGIKDGHNYSFVSSDKGRAVYLDTHLPIGTIKTFELSEVK